MIKGLKEYYRYGNIGPNYEFDINVSSNDSTAQFCISQIKKCRVPDIIKDFINKKGCLFFFTDSQTKGSADAWYSYPKMVIRLDKKSSLAHKAGISMHEYCHCYDHIIGGKVFDKSISDTDEGKFIYEANKNDDILPMYKKNIGEFYAYCIQRYYCGRKKFNEQFPDAFEYLRHVEKMFIINLLK